MSVEMTYEITMLEPIIEPEFEMWATHACADGDITALNASGRVILLETEKDVDEVISILAQAGMADDVGLIRQIVEYVPERSMIEIEFEPDFDLGKD